MHKYVREAIPQPAAGADISNFPSTSAEYRLLTVRAKLTTSATAASRYPHFRFVTPSGDVFFETVPSAAQIASKTVFYMLTSSGGAPNEGSAVNDDVSGLSLPDFWIGEGCKFETSTTAIDPGDQWSDIYAKYLIRDELGMIALIEQALAQHG